MSGNSGGLTLIVNPTVVYVRSNLRNTGDTLTTPCNRKTATRWPRPLLYSTLRPLVEKIRQGSFSDEK